MMSSRPLTSLSYASRREVVARVAPEYREASCAQKTLLLDTIVTMTGYARKYAIRLLNQAPEGKGKDDRPSNIETLNFHTCFQQEEISPYP